MMITVSSWNLYVYKLPILFILSQAVSVMESEVVRSQVQDENDEQQPFNSASQLEEHNDPDEKKSSVMNKVKARAKKIKDTVKKHGQRVLDHVHDNQSSSSEDQNSPDVDNRALVDETGDVKDAPPTYQEVEKYVKSAAAEESEQEQNLGKSEVNYGGTTNMEEEPQDKAGSVGVSPTSESIATEEENLDEDLTTPENIPGLYTTTQNYQTEATHPTGTVGESEGVQSGPPTYEQVEDFVKSAEPEPEKVENLDKSVPSSGGTTAFTETNEEIATEKEKFKGNLDEDLRPPGSRPEAYTIPPSYQAEDTDPIGKGTDDEIKITQVEKSFEERIKDDPKSILVPKFLPDSADGNQDQSLQKPDHQLSTATKTEHPPYESHERDLPEISTITETQIASDNTIPSNTSSYKENPEATEQTFNSNISSDEVEKPSNEKSYTDEISSATSAIAAGNAVSAEDVAAVSKKGDRDDKVTTLEEERSEDSSSMSGSSLGYGKNIANSVTEKLAPVYGKVAGVGSAVKSKVSGTKSDDSVGVEAENVEKAEDKRVNVKDYLAEKLKPGEEDKALSEVISEAFNKRKEEPNKSSEDSEGKKKVKSETVGEGEESNVSSPGKSVVGKIKGVVGSWFGKSEENQSSKGGEDLTWNKNGGERVEEVSQAEGETRLEE
ncbi:hypothetical protein PIB30_006005 [Stylosanthes scabra]|uniref:Low-temperature-induced 65 kDa protein n=1 Tax=Stylosanthes scabra TaxID=79078 RepID=A0ABU6T405_9FABA|nr:hypothetical protein [Stylosanthes scabra]